MELLHDRAAAPAGFSRSSRGRSRSSAPPTRIASSRAAPTSAKSFSRPEMRRPRPACRGRADGLTCAYTWPLRAAPASTASPHDRGDPLLVTWILWWSTQAVPLTAAWWNAPAFYPSTGVFWRSRRTCSAWRRSPRRFIALTRIAAARLQRARSSSATCCAALAPTFSASRSRRRHDAAFVAAVAFAFAPYRLSHLQHLQLLSSVLDAGVARRAASLPARTTAALRDPLRGQLAAAGAGVRLLLLLPHRCSWCSGSRWFAVAPARGATAGVC